MFFEPYRIEGRVSIGTATQNMFSFSIDYFNPDSFNLISCIYVSSLKAVEVFLV